jgi:L-threonylcarbamoyladenylate synthase
VETLRLRGDEPEPEALARAVAVLASGRLLIYPTDTLYALGGSLAPEAVRRIRAAKHREAGKALPLVVADSASARAVAGRWSATAEALAARFWPGPLTLVLPAAAIVPETVTAGGGTVAVRVPALRLTRELCAAAGPLVSTSANLAGGSPPSTCAEAVAAVGAAAALALDAGQGGGAPSTIVDVCGPTPRLVRAGAIAWRAVEDFLLSVPPC